MWISWKRYSLAFLLVSLSLVLTGCGDFGGGGAGTAQESPTPATKTISGFVSDLGTGLPVIGASVAAYPIDSTGVQGTTPVSLEPVSVLTGSNGGYTLNIPLEYSGSLMVEATVTPTTLMAKFARALALTSGTKIRSAVPATVVAQPALPPVMVSFATDAVVKFLEANVQGSTVAAGFSSNGMSPENIQKATLVLETFFGQNFTQTPPPKSELEIQNSSKAQQDLLVVIQALNSVATNNSVAIEEVVSLMATSGLGAVAAVIETEIRKTATVTLAGVIPPEYVTSVAITTAIAGAATAAVLPPDLADSTPPSVPGSLAAIPAGATKVALNWSASTDNSALAGYTISRAALPESGAVAEGDFTVIDTVGKSSTSYTDLTVSASTRYSYRVAAFDAARNVSAWAVVIATTPAATPIDANPVPATYTITGKVTENGVAVANVLITVSGAGSGSVATKEDGSYTIPVINGFHLLTPSLGGNLFAPASRTVGVSGANVTGQDFALTRTGSATGTVTYPAGTVIGGVVYPNGVVTGTVSFPVGTVIGGVTYPAGTIIGGISYPSGVVIGGVTYPTSTVIGGVTYPTGVVIGGVTYPTGVVIGGVSYPAGTIVGGVAFPVGAVTTGVAYPSGTVIGGVVYPTGTASGGVIYPGGSVVGGVSYPTGVVIGGTTYPSGTVLGSTSYPTGTVIGSVNFPSGSVVGSVTYPTGSISGSTAYPTGSLTGALFFPLGETLNF